MSKPTNEESKEMNRRLDEALKKFGGWNDEPIIFDGFEIEQLDCETLTRIAHLYAHKWRESEEKVISFVEGLQNS